MARFATILAAALLTSSLFAEISQAGGVCCQPGNGCQLPVAKTYKIQPSYCPQELAAMIPQCVPGGCSGDCGPYGVPPIFASGNNLVIRQTPEVHERIAKYLESIGAYMKPTFVNGPR